MLEFEQIHKEPTLEIGLLDVVNLLNQHWEYQVHELQHQWQQAL